MTLYHFDPEWPPKWPLRVIKKLRVKRLFRVNKIPAKKLHQLILLIYI
jgi:hypothetical protein